MTEIDQELVEFRQRLLQILSTFSYCSSVEQILKSFHGFFFGFFGLIVRRFSMVSFDCNGSGDCSNCIFDDCIFNGLYDCWSDPDSDLVNGRFDQEVMNGEGYYNQYGRFIRYVECD